MHNLDDILKVCTALTPPRLRQLRRLTEAGASPCPVLYWAADALYRRQVLPAEDVHTILSTFVDDFRQLNNELHEARQSGVREIPASLLTIHDRRWIHTGIVRWLAGEKHGEPHGFLDLESGDILPELPLPAVEILAYDLTAVYLGYVRQLERQNRAVGSAP